MAYLRGDYYFGGDGENIHLWVKEDVEGGVENDLEGYTGISLPYGVLDEYVVMRLAEMLYAGSIESTIDRAIGHNNFQTEFLIENAESIKQALQKIMLKPLEESR